MMYRKLFVNIIVLFLGIICTAPVIAIIFFNATHPSLDDKYVGSNAPKNVQDRILGRNFRIGIDAVLMPKSRGYGDLYTWQVAMTLDPILLKMAQDILANDPKNIQLINDKFEKFLFRWAGVEDATLSDVYKSISLNTLLAPREIEFMLDARKIAFLQKITGLDFINANKTSLTGAKESWDEFFNHFLSVFLVQGNLRNIFTNSHYSFREDKLIIKNSLDDVIANMQFIARSMDSRNSVNYANFVQNIIKLNKSSFNDPDFDKKVNAIFLQYQPPK